MRAIDGIGENERMLLLLCASGEMMRYPRNEQWKFALRLQPQCLCSP